jgi:peptidoglycan-associated lipoprotein
MKTRILSLCVPLALVLAGGCATQSKNDAASSGSPSGAATSSASPATPGAAPSGGMSGTRAGGDAAAPSARSVYYDFDKSDLRSGDRGLVEANAQYLARHSDVKVRVEGNADERGSKEYNLALGQRRAEGVAKAMELLGVSDKRIEAVSYGEEKPKAKGHDEQAWAQNRRSDIVY